MIEAICRKCGEVFNPNGTEDNPEAPEHPVHYVRASDERPCGGLGDIVGEWH